jgi:hypothetical protein
VLTFSTAGRISRKWVNTNSLICTWLPFSKTREVEL